MHVNVVGGANVDIMAKSKEKVNLHDSNIGRVEFSHGGVGRNIVHNCALLGLDCSFVSAMGDDANAYSIIEELSALNINTSNVLISPERQTGIYCSFIDDGGDMLCAVNDMHVMELITPQYLEKAQLPYGIIATDTNLSEESLEFLTSLPAISVFAEPVSVKKALKLKGMLKNIDIIKPNIYEAEALSGVKICCENDIIAAGNAIIEQGVRVVFLTAGENGVYAFLSGSSMVHVKHSVLTPVNATGAGDAFSAGIIYGVANGLSVEKTCDFAAECAAMALMAKETVNKAINAETINERLKGR